MTNKLYKLTVSKEDILLINQSLDLYSRIGIGQLDTILDHPTYERSVHELSKEVEGKVNYRVYHSKKDFLRSELLNIFNILTGEHYMANASYGIHNEKVADECRQAFDLKQIFRHHFYDGGYGVDSHIYLTAKERKVEAKIEDIEN